MVTISLDESKTLGAVKPVNGVGQPPVLGMDYRYLKYLTDIGTPFVRPHDFSLVSGAPCFTHAIDVPGIFPDFNADPADPASYDFAFTDKFMEAMQAANLPVFYRLGVSIENYCQVKAYHIYPPADSLQWARICAGIIRHYREGWANGYHYDTRYWEIWNEPDNHKNPDTNMMWRGTKEQYYALYGTASRYLKNEFPDIMIGGYASCGFYGLYADMTEDFEHYFDFFNGFLAYVKENDCPLDFFSWHNYGDARNVKMCADYARRRLDEEGFTQTEHTCNEWNCEPHTRGTLHHAARNTAVLIAMQESSLDSAMFYDAKIGTSMYGGLFNPLDRKPLPLYYGFAAFGELRARGTQVACRVTGGTEEISALAAKGENDLAVLAVNESAESVPLCLECDARKVTSCKIITEGKIWEDIPLPDTLPAESILFVTLA